MKTGKIVIAALFIIFIANPALSQSITLVAVGDSLTAGDGDDGSGGGYPARLLTMLQSDYPGSTLSNRAISGDTTQDLINKQLTDAVSDVNAAPAGNLKIALIWIGSNDLFGLYASDVCTEYYPDLPTCEQAEMASSYDNVNTIVNNIKAAGASVYIALLDDQTKRPVIADASLRNETFPGITDDEVPRMSAQIINYNSQIKAHAATHGAVTVDFFNTTIFENASTLSDDGNHPNGAGYDAIARIWYQEITGTASPPSVVTGAATSVTSTGAALNGSVNPNGSETNYYFEYGPTAGYGSQTSSKSAGSGASSMEVNEPVSGLISGTVYHFRLTAENGEGVSHGNDQTFTTRNDTIVSGNIDGSPDGLVNLADAILALQVCAGISPVNAVLSAEVNQDKRIGIAEAIYAMQTVAGTGESGNLVQPSDFQYLGAFRLPGGDDNPPETFSYGGNAMTFRPDGDPTNSDEFSGSLFIMGHDRTDVYAGNQVAEVSIPVPAAEGNPENLPQAAFIQNFQNVLEGKFTIYEVPKAGMQYLNHPDTGALIHFCWGVHLQPEDMASHGWFSADLSNPNFKGIWHIGDYLPHSVNAYMLDIPQNWANAHVSGKMLGTGRAECGGQGGMGPTLIAYRPWSAGGNAPADGTRLEAAPLILYDSALQNNNIENCLRNYQHADLWEGGVWIETPSGKSAVLFSGTKATGTKYWYGYVHHTDPAKPCLDLDETSMVLCRNADGTRCPDEDFEYCCNENAGDCASGRAWWSNRYDARFLLYDPDDLAKVAAGLLQPWEPQAYAFMDVDEFLYLILPEWEVFELGSGDMRRHRIGDVAFDREHAYLYAIEYMVDGGKPVIHVWKIQ